jgi:hypothetical protein
MEQSELQSYMSRFIEAGKTISGGLLNRQISNKDIGAQFPALPHKDVLWVLEHLAQQGFIDVVSDQPFLDERVIKSFVLTQKALNCNPLPP